MSNNRFRKGFALAAVLATGMLGAGSAQADTYYLTESSDDLTHVSGTGWVTGNIPDGNTYATVTILDGASGNIDFTVTLSDYWIGKMDSGFGIDSFGFNVLPPEADNGLTSADIIDISGGVNWTTNVDYSSPPPIEIAQDGFGKFDAVVSTNSAANRVGTLTFSIANSYSVDEIADYVALSTPGDNGSHLFALHVAGMLDQNPLDPGGTCPGTPDANIQDCNLLTSAWFGSGEDGLPPSAIPVPAAVWLFGSGLLGLAGVARRRRTA